MEKKRLKSLDALRGFDLFLLFCLGGIIIAGAEAFQWPWLKSLAEQCDHVWWTGYRIWDQIMPLFMFMAGVSIPFAFGKYREEQRSKKQIYWRIGRRFVVLWILGMICQGNLLTFQPGEWKWYSNTLQTIAVGYLASSLMFLHTKPKTQIITAICLTLAYWAAMMFIKVDGFGGGDFTPDGNFAEWVDRAVMGYTRPGTKMTPDGGFVFSEGYRYTWILSSLNFIVTVMSGMFAGEVLKNKGKTGNQKALFLIVLGAICIGAGLLWGLQMPIVKRIWTSSMTVFSSGISFLLMGVFYWMIDVKEWKGFDWLTVFGMNSIFVYMLPVFVSFKGIAAKMLPGLMNYISESCFVFCTEVAGAILLYLLLKLMKKKEIFLKV